MRRAQHPEAGVTLIEILIAVSLLSLLSVGILIAMRIGFNTMDKVDNRLVADRRIAYARRIIDSQIAGLTATSADWRPESPNRQIVPFYQWEPGTMRFVTTYSLQDASRGRPQIDVFQVIPGANGSGVRLIVNETPWTGPLQTGQMITGIDPDFTIHFAPAEAGPQSFVLADRLAYCRFSYLEPKNEPPYEAWRQDWIDRQHLPLGIRIEMAPLDDSPNSLHVSTITAALNVNRELIMTYADTL